MTHDTNSVNVWVGIVNRIKVRNFVSEKLTITKALFVSVSVY